MADPLLTLLAVAAILIAVDVLLAGGMMTMTGMSAVAGIVAHPLAGGAIVLLVIVAILVLASGS
ncbi:MAG: hypothetical protein ACLGIJ_13620 [Candidatus Limnocylindria bacterium]